MCVIILKEMQPKVAEQDITCYKGLKPGLRPWHFDKIQYELGKLFETKMEAVKYFNPCDKESSIFLSQKYGDIYSNENRERLQSIGPGFHSASSLERVKRSCKSLLNEDEPVFYECTIPKGALYYEEGDELYVSNQIIINKLIKE